MVRVDNLEIVAQNAGILAAQMISLTDKELAQRVADFKENLKVKIENANKELSKVKYDFKTN